MTQSASFANDSGDGTPPPVRVDSPAPHVARITLARGDDGNRVDAPLFYALDGALRTAALDDEVRVIMLAADGPDFSLGQPGASTMAPDPAGFEPVGLWNAFSGAGSEGDFAREAELSHGLVDRWRAMPKPLVAQVQGRVVGAGLALMWASDIIVASEDASFRDPSLLEGNIGIAYFAHPAEMGVRKAKEFLFGAEVFDAKEAFRIGMVNRVVANDRLADEALEIAVNIAGKAAFALKLTKETINAAEDAGGRDVSMRTAFAYRQLLKAHWTRLGGFPPAATDRIERK